MPNHHAPRYTEVHRRLARLLTTIERSSNSTHGLRRTLRQVRGELELYRYHVRGRKSWTAKKARRRYDQVQIGGGTHLLPGYLNIDVIPPADLLYDVREGLPLRTASVSRIFTEHFLEHIDYPISVKAVVAECGRVMRSGGTIIIGVPDGGLAARQYVTKNRAYARRLLRTWYRKRTCRKDINTDIDLLNYVWRDQDDDPKYHPHYWGYDFDKLKSLLVSAGFHAVRRWKFDPNLANPKREFGSIYVTAKKR